jgi:hypothetical protein
MGNEGFSKIRNGLREHIKDGRMHPTDLGVYLYLHMACDYATGIYKGTALGIAYGFGDESLKDLVKHSLYRLRNLKYINYRFGNGLRRSYSILIDKYEPTYGARSGTRLNAWIQGDKVIPEYEPVPGESPGENPADVPLPARWRPAGIPLASPIPDLQTSKTEKTVQTTTDNGSSSAVTLPPVVPTEVGTGEKDDTADLRQWDKEMFGVPAQRIRNCLAFVLDEYKSDYYRNNPPTVDSMYREKFIRGIDRITPANWTPEMKAEPKGIPGWSGQHYTANEVKF